VPLCGKTLDMLWLHQQGYKVLGVELSEKAVIAFFEENNLPYEANASGSLQLFTGVDKAAGIRILAGDMFAMDNAQTAGVSALFDRAAMVAMPPEMRPQYVDKLAALLPSAATGILIRRELLTPHYTLSVLEHLVGPDRLGNLQERGLDTLEEHVYRMTKI